MSKINLKITKEESEEYIKQLIAPGLHKDLVAKALFHSLDDNNYLEQIILASMGITPKLNFYKGDVVLIEPSSIVNDWCFDLEAMTTQGIIKQGRMEACILETNPWKYRSYLVSYSYIHKDQKISVEDTSWISEYKMQSAEDFPEDLNSET